MRWPSKAPKGSSEDRVSPSCSSCVCAVCLEAAAATEVSTTAPLAAEPAVPPLCAACVAVPCIRCGDTLGRVSASAVVSTWPSRGFDSPLCIFAAALPDNAGYVGCCCAEQTLNRLRGLGFALALPRSRGLGSGAETVAAGTAAIGGAPRAATPHKLRALLLLLLLLVVCWPFLAEAPRRSAGPPLTTRCSSGTGFLAARTAAPSTPPKTEPRALWGGFSFLSARRPSCVPLRSLALWGMVLAAAAVAAPLVLQPVLLRPANAAAAGPETAIFLLLVGAF